MRSRLRRNSSLALAVVIGLSAPLTSLRAQTAEPTTFSHAIVVRDADRLAQSLKSIRDSEAGQKARTIGATALRAAGFKALEDGKDLREAMRALTLAAAINPKDIEVLSGIAKAALAIEPSKSAGAERYELPVTASGAAFEAFRQASQPGQKAAALALLAEAMKRRALWRPAIEALRVSLALADNPDVAQTLDELRAEHGFRVVDYKVDSDAETPRLCINFSERLAAAAPDAAKFLSIDGREPESLTTEGNQLCLDGLKHGNRYEVRLRPGLPADTSETLRKASEMAIYVRDRKPAVRLSGRAYVLPSRGQQGVPVTSINASALDVEIYRVGDRGLGLAASQENFLKAIETYDIEQIREKSGKKIWNGTLEVANRLNQDVTTAIPVSDVLGRPEPGIYIVTAAIAGKGGDGDSQQATRAAQWFLVSDLGLTAFSGEDGLHVFVRSLASAEAQGKVRVKLVARNNEILGTAESDARGYVRFDPALLRGEGGNSARLVVAEGQSDYALLDLASTAFDLTDRGVKGRTAPGPIDGFLYAERGVYRPGETVNVTGLLRTSSGGAAASPSTLIVTRPDGVEHRRLVLADQGLGGRTTALALGAQAMTGTWRARLHTDPKANSIAETTFLVEDFVPERLAFDLTPAGPAIRAGEAIAIDVAGRYLYGPPAAGLALEGEIRIKPSMRELPGFAGYRFGVATDVVPNTREPLENLGVTATDGRASIAAVLPKLPKTSRPLDAEILVRLRETGGRAIERKVALAVDAGEARIGVKSLFSGDQIAEGDEAAFDLVALGADGTPLAAQPLKWEVVRIEQRWQWYAHEGSWRHEAQTFTRRIASGTAEPKAGAPARIAVKPEWGRFRLDVTTAEPGGPRTVVAFSTGWQAKESADSPEALDIALDKQAYKAGETARLKITSRDAGRALVTVVANGLLDQREVAVPKGGTEIAIPVDAKWLPGAYVAATLFRTLDEGSKRMPGRSLGLAWLALDTKPHTLDVAVAVPERALPARPLSIPVKIAGLAGGEDARVTVAAVDVGILNLTRYETPAPEKHFLAQRKLGLEVRDLYGRLIDGMRAERGRLRSGGDGGGGMTSEGSPPTEAPLSLFSGIVKVGPDGTANVTFDMPDFNGTVRVMAVAWSGTKVGSTSKDLIVRDKVALTVSGPRFLTLGDSARVEVDVHNVEAAAGTFKVEVSEAVAGGAGRSLAGRDFTLNASERRRESVPLKPDAIGRRTLDVRVTGGDGVDVRRRIALDVAPPAAGIKRSTIAQLAARTGKLSISKDLFQDLIPSTAKLAVTVGPTAAFDVAGLLGELDRYPYGCAEQTTSRALPLLYLSSLATKLGLAEETEIRGRITKAIERLGEMQDSSGAFGAWGPTDGDLWLTAYVTDFMTRARETGYEVRREPFQQALDRLANAISYQQEFEKGGEARAYALYVLARNARAPVGDLRYDVDTRLEKFATPLAKAQLGAALALLGDQDRAGRAFTSAMSTLEGDKSKLELDRSRADYGSLVRDGAAMLTLVAETGAGKARQADLTRVLAAAFRSRTYTSTQEQAWMVLAARALAEDAKAVRLTVSGGAHQGELARTFRPADLERGAADIVNQGANPLDAVITVEGASLTPEPAVARGFSIERAYYSLDGKKVDLASASGGTSQIAQNERFVAVVTIKGEDAGGRVLVADRLPAGFEVENPRLVDGGDVSALAWLKGAQSAKHTEFRDDRVVAAFDFFGRNGGGEGAKSEPVAATVAYIVRAVTPGTFVHPAATVEDMYRPERHARTAAGKLEIVPAR